MTSNIPNHPSPIQVLSSNVERAELDDRSYRLIKLVDNKLEVLLVHDPTTENSSAAMDVHVGNLSDPKDFPGLAHALEHCLFLGNVILQASLILSRNKEVSRGK
jgi:insulysin